MQTQSTLLRSLHALFITGVFAFAQGCAGTASGQATETLDDAQLENLVRRSCQYQEEESR